MLNEPSTTDTGLTRYEKGRIDEMILVNALLGKMVDEAGDDGVDPGRIEHFMETLELEGQSFFVRVQAAMTKYRFVVQDTHAGPMTGGAVGRAPEKPTAMSTFLIEGPCNVLEGAAVDIRRVVADLKGAHAGRYTDTLLRLADELTSEAGSMRLMAERAEEDGDE